MTGSESFVLRNLQQQQRANLTTTGCTEFEQFSLTSNISDITICMKYMESEQFSLTLRVSRITICTELKPVMIKIVKALSPPYRK